MFLLFSFFYPKTKERENYISFLNQKIQKVFISLVCFSFNINNQKILFSGSLVKFKNPKKSSFLNVLNIKFLFHLSLFLLQKKGSKRILITCFFLNTKQIFISCSLKNENGKLSYFLIFTLDKITRKILCYSFILFSPLLLF